MRYFISLTVLFVISCNQVFGSSEYWSGKCLKKNARYAVADQCDAYVECKHGVSEHKLCSDGLLFKVSSRNEKNNFCKYPNEVTCASRARLQPAQPSGECPHQNGYFRLGGPDQCGEYLLCDEGRGFRMNCAVGLAFNSKTYQCDWPDQVSDCNPETYLQFQCPREARSGAEFLASDWAKKEFEAAHQQAIADGVNRLVVVTICDLGDIQDIEDKLCPILKGYLKGNLYIKYDDVWFYDKLRYALTYTNRLPIQLPIDA